MNETPQPFDHNDLSENDLAVLRAFEAAEELVVKSVTANLSPASQPPQPAPDNVPEGMLVLFITEADEDIAVMRETLRQLEQDDPADSTSFVTLQRMAHKLKGTAGSIGYERMATIAHYVEKLVYVVKRGTINNLTGLITLVQAVQALEATLYSIAADGKENDAPLAELEAMFDTLNVNIRNDDAIKKSSSQQTQAITHAASIPLVQVDAQHLEQLLKHIEQLAEQRPSLESAQAEVETAQQELYTAQARLQHLETLLASASLSRKVPDHGANDEPPTASLVARILNESVRRTGHTNQRKGKSRSQLSRSQQAQGTLRWDELEIETYTDDELLVRSLSEAIADITTASSRLRLALAQFNQALQKQITQTALVRSDVLRLPHAHKAIQCLLIQVGANGQQVAVPFSQVRRIDYKREEWHNPLYVLTTLLGFAEEQVSETTRPVLMLEMNGAAVQVDEILGEVEVVMKPLADHLQRPGIAGAATDGLGHVLLVVDLPTLVMRKDAAQQTSTIEMPHRDKRPSQQRRRVLIADDSVYIRQSVLQILSHAGYDAIEARDGVEALERLLSHSIDVLLLDIEMPNLNGYELLNIIRANAQFAQLKVIMLTSRSSEKHQRHAQELGSHAYLTKPCPQDVLLTTISSVLI
jgi:chemotaxis protein histidine kinase CheA/CheY-like chemotaxis protein